MNNVHENDFKIAMQQIGLDFDGVIIADGRLHRVHINGDSTGSLNGWYVLFPGQIYAGAFGCWKRDIFQNWCTKNIKNLSGEEQRFFQERMDGSRLEIEKVRLQRNTEAQEKAIKILANSVEADNTHAYLKNKNVKSFGLHISQYGDLVIPLRDTQDNLHSLQFIKTSGDKRFLTGGSKAGNYFQIGHNPETIYICEGYATGATIHEATNCLVVVAFDSGNLLLVAQNIKEKYPNSEIILTADNDQFTEINTGVTKATEAAKTIQGKIVIPDFDKYDTSSKPTDFNDLKKFAGIDEVLRQLSENLKSNSIISKQIDDNAIINNLASLSSIEYERAREEQAKTLGIRVSILDDLVKEKRNQNKDSEKSIIFPNIEPWPDQIDGAALLYLIEEKLKQFVILNSHEARAITLWILFTYCIDAVSVSPILNITSPEKRCGKSTVMTLLQLFVNRPLLAANISPAAVFRTIEALNPTLLLDETDTFINDDKSELRGIINSGHTRASAFVIRTVGDNHEPKRFSTWSAKCLAGIGNLPDTIKDRSIIIQLRRKLSHEVVESLRHADKSIFMDIQRQCARFIKDNITVISMAKPDLPSTLNDRAADSWEPLIAIADCAGGDWPKKSREAAIVLSGTEESVSTSVELLQDIKNIFEEKKISRISTKDLLDALCADDEAPWSLYNRGKPLTPRQLSKKLKDFGIKSGNFRFGTTVLKGFDFDSMKDAFERYIPLAGLNTDSLSATALQANNDKGLPHEN